LGFMIARLLIRQEELGRVRRALAVTLGNLTYVPLTVPAVLFGVGFLVTYLEGPIVLYGTDALLVLVYVTIMVPFATRMQLAGMVALGNSYVEASRASGAGMLRTSLQILLPLTRGTIGAAGALMFIMLSHEFTASLLVRTPSTQVMG